MAIFLSRKISKTNQYLFSVLLIGAIACVCYFLSSFIGYRVVAFVLLVSVSLIAMFFDIRPVLLSALLSALIWDFFFIPPRFTFHVESAEDSLMLLMYFVIAMVNAVLTFKIRQIEKVAREKEEKANTIKLYNNLLNSLSHELKTPIATIIGATDNLITDANKISNENKSALLAEISVASLRLNQQVENLLNMSRLESGYIQLKKDWCDVNELVYSVVNSLEDKLKTHQLKILISEKLPLFKLDFGLMEQVLRNLISNAIIYTPENSTITITAECRSEINGHFSTDRTTSLQTHTDVVLNRLVIFVSDNGKGFPDDEIKKVFEKFYRLKNSKAGGTGLGLSIAKGFTEAHNGKISLMNNKEGGATFTVEIPAETSFLNNLKNE